MADASQAAPNAAEDGDGGAPLGAWGLTLRERWVAGALLLLAVLAALALAAAFWQPGPPTRVVMSTGAEGGAYHAFGERYRAVLARSGVELVLLPSAGALQNLERLRRREGGVTLALVQGGLAQPGDADKLVSLGAVAYEPLWIFHRKDVPIGGVEGFKGLRIAGGAPGSGTRVVAEALLRRQGLESTSTLLPLGGTQAADALESGDADVVLMVSAPEAEAEAVQRLLRASGVALWSMQRADAYVRHFPVLTRLEIPEGGVDLQRDLPPQPTTLVTLKASLVATEDIHPVLVELLLDAAREVHGGGGPWRHRPAQLRRLANIESRINGMRIPLSFAGEAYALRTHVQLVRERLFGKAVDA